MPVCANCHSFSKEGSILAMDVDYASDKGSYVSTKIKERVELKKRDVISWSDFKREEKEPTFGLLSQISPDGRYLISTVKDVSVFVAVPEIEYSQQFFPIRGILAVYDRQEKRFFALPGADDPNFVQSNPTWTPDGKAIVFARAKAVKLKGERSTSAVISNDNMSRLLQYDRFSFKRGGGQKYRYDLYRIPFNAGKGGEAKPIPGASQNGKSNYFAKFSPDGKWMVFCQADSFMLLQPDSALYILPTAGGSPRRLISNAEGKMNSWHSFSPNGRWLVFSSKRGGPYTQLWLSHIDEQGRDRPAVLLEWFNDANRAVNIPEFVNIDYEKELLSISDATSSHYSYYRAAQQYVDLNDYKLAAEQLKTSLEIKEDEAASHRLMGEVMRQLNAPQALSHLQRAVQLSPHDQRARLELARLLSERKEWPAALEQLRQVLAGNSAEPEAFALRGHCLLSQGKSQEAVKALERALLLAPEEIPHRLSFVRALRSLGEDQRALQELKRVLKQKPGEREASLQLAWLLSTSIDEELHDAKLALKLAEAVCQDGGCPTPRQQMIWAAALAEAGQQSQALSILQGSLKQNLRPGLRQQIEAQAAHYRAGKRYRVPKQGP